MVVELLGWEVLGVVSNGQGQSGQSILEWVSQVVKCAVLALELAENLVGQFENGQQGQAFFTQT